MNPELKALLQERFYRLYGRTPTVTVYDNNPTDEELGMLASAKTLGIEVKIKHVDPVKPKSEPELSQLQPGQYRHVVRERYRPSYGDWGW